MRVLIGLVAPLLLAMALATPLFASPSTPDYLDWLETRRQLWVQEMKRMESHEHGQYKVEYHQLSERMTKVREQAGTLRGANGVEADELREKLLENVSEVEAGLEFLLSETPELAEQKP